MHHEIPVQRVVIPKMLKMHPRQRTPRGQQAVVRDTSKFRTDIPERALGRLGLEATGSSAAQIIMSHILLECFALKTHLCHNSTQLVLRHVV